MFAYRLVSEADLIDAGYGSKFKPSRTRGTKFQRGFRQRLARRQTTCARRADTMRVRWTAPVVPMPGLILGKRCPAVTFPKMS
jgi:hypothetical protein